MSPPVPVSVTDPPPQPVLSMDPPSGAVSEGLPLSLTCAVTRVALERRFHFYKDGTKIVPGDLESEISTSEPSTSSVNVSVLSIWAGHDISGEFACGYEENVNGRWLLSPRSQAVTITVTASHHTRDTLLTTAGVLLVAGGLAALICCCRRKKKVPKPLKSTEESEAEELTRNLDPSCDNKEAKARGAGEQQMEQDSEVTYAVIAPAALKAHTTQSKTKSKPDEEEHVLYSEVATKHNRRQLNKEGKPSLCLSLYFCVSSPSSRHLHP
ncbi:uncharacterized protein LOC142821258 [Pelodiscus sinensis]|uniref:uncharacterized protein LOC142821258 n=1 Tax=Pelodiscus sinensis TaxID=13735 RepID=UPI003F6AC2A9